MNFISYYLPLSMIDSSLCTCCVNVSTYFHGNGSYPFDERILFILIIWRIQAALLRIFFILILFFSWFYKISDENWSEYGRKQTSCYGNLIKLMENVLMPSKSKGRKGFAGFVGKRQCLGLRQINRGKLVCPEIWNGIVTKKWYYCRFDSILLAGKYISRFLWY